MGSIALSQKMARENKAVFLPKQFENLYNSDCTVMTLRYKRLIEAALLFRRQQLLRGVQNDERIATPEIRDRPTDDTMKKYCWYHNSKELYRSATQTVKVMH